VSECGGIIHYSIVARNYPTRYIDVLLVRVVAATAADEHHSTGKLNYLFFVCPAIQWAFTMIYSSKQKRSPFLLQK